MQRNNQVIIILLAAICIGFAQIQANRATGADIKSTAELEFEGDLIFSRELPVGLVAGTSDHPHLFEIKSIRFETTYGNAWQVTARVGWLPAEETAWKIKVEMLDGNGRVLQHSRDDITTFICKTRQSNETDMQYVDLDLSSMLFQGRRHAKRFRIHLQQTEDTTKKTNTDENQIHALKISVIEQESAKPVSDATVVIGSFYNRDSYRQEKSLYATDSQGQCNIRFSKNGLVTVRANVYKQNYTSNSKSWSNNGPSFTHWLPLVNLPEQYTFEIAPAVSVGGIVRNSDGQAIESAEVGFSVTFEDSYERTYIRRSVCTDSNGRWSVDGIPADIEQFRIKLRHPEYSGGNGRFIDIEGESLLNARALKHVEIIEKGLPVTGKVLDEQGQPVAEATVMLTQRSDASSFVFSDTSGNFRLFCSDNMSNYRELPIIIVEAPGYCPVQKTISIGPDIEPLEFRLSRGRTVNCRVVDTDGNPVAGSWTVFGPLQVNRYYSIWLEDTDEQGKFKIPNAPNHDINLTVGKRGFITIRNYLIEPSQDEVIVTMEYPMRIHGMVTDAQNGKPIPNFEIAMVYNSINQIRTSRAAQFIDGQYELNFDEAGPESCRLKVTAVGYEPVVSDEFNIDEGILNINFELKKDPSFNTRGGTHRYGQARPSGPRMITGVVRDEQGRPVPGATVTTVALIAQNTLTNTEGEFSLRLNQRPLMSSREETPYLIVRCMERNLAEAVALDESKENLETKLSPGVITSGKVVDVNGAGINEAKISLDFCPSDIGYSVKETTKIDPEGNFQIRALPAGYQFYVNASADGYGQKYARFNTSDAVEGRIELEPMALAVANLSVSSIIVDEFDQPVPNVRIFSYGNGQPPQETLTDSEGKFSIENICAGPIRIQADKRGTERLLGRAATTGGTKDIKIVVNPLDNSGRSIVRQPPSLRSKPLPDMGNFKFLSEPEPGEANVILVCFFDMQQRPSRHYITQLTAQTERLKQQGVTITTIQASKIDQDELGEWIKDNNVPFPVGMIETDEKMTQFSWGVKSLPWLILTDTEKIVRAEGFGLDELDEKILQARGGK